MKKISLYITALAVFALSFSACDKEYTNPSTAGEQQVVKDVNGLIALANGLQYRYSIGRTSPVYCMITGSGLTTKELLVKNAGNTDEQQLMDGLGNVAAGNSVVSRNWEQCNLIKANADLILNNLGPIGDPPTKNSLICYANLFKGLALLQQGTNWEQAPLAVGRNAAFSPRTDVLKAALALFEGGATASTGLTISTKFIGGINFPNTFNALIARTNLMLGNYDAALTAANKVDLKSKSNFTYDDATRNPIFDVSYSGVNVCEPVDSVMGLPAALKPDAKDKRVLFYLKAKTKVATANMGKGFFTANTAPIPVYLPGEVILIKAECYARQTKLPEAVTELDKILTKKAADDVWGVGADLPGFAGDKTNKDAILNEIYRQRCIELFNSGLKLEDSRRFGRPGPKDTGSERSRNFYPYPQNERDNNTNTPSDPANG
jgi:starch-binding outer membrane protein, SusD/RagB family